MVEIKEVEKISLSDRDHWQLTFTDLLCHLCLTCGKTPHQQGGIILSRSYFGKVLCASGCSSLNSGPCIRCFSSLPIGCVSGGGRGQEDGAKVPAEDSAKVPAEDSTKGPAEDSGKGPGEDSAKGPAEDSARGPGGDSAKGPGDDSGKCQFADGTIDV